MKISIVSPVYQSEKIIHQLVERIQIALTEITEEYEIILVEDGSPDNAWEVIEEVCKKNKKVKGIRLSRNFGQHYAVTAGLEYSKGEIIIIMDCDLQDDPSNIKSLIDKCNEGYDVVFTKRIKRNHGIIKAIAAFIYNFLYRFISDSSYDTSFGSMVLLRRQVSLQILKLRESNRLYLQLIKWVGFKQTFIYASHSERYQGKSSYSFRKLLKLAVAGWISHSNRLLYIAIYIGFGFSFISFGFIAYIVYLFFVESLLSGWPSLIAVMLLSSGLVLMAIGILGIYIGKIFDQVKERPLYVIKKILNEEY